MQTKNTPKSLKQKVLTGVAIGITAVGSLFNSGCANPEARLKKYQQDVIQFKKQGLDDLFFCVCDDPDPQNQEYLDNICKQAIKEDNVISNENFREQGTKLWALKIAPMTNLDYTGNFLFFSKQHYPDRYVVKLDTLTAYEHIKDNEWKPSRFMTQWVRNGKDIYAAIDKMKAQANANNQNTNQADRNANVMDDIKGRVGGNLATIGILEALSTTGQ